ncbi:MAG: thiol peroxidase [Deltaproteobacteria bacterium]|nr:MAG: thiol peroxidase [Deltaproteobacteria bacterium]
MATVTFKGNPVSTVGELPAVGSEAPDFTLVTTELSEISLHSFSGTKVLNIFPSLDTGVCATSVRTFNAKAAGLQGVKVINVSADLPFAHKRFCSAEGIENTINASTFRSAFLDAYGVRMTSGPLAGLAARSVVVIDETGTVKYTQLVPEIVTEPDYDAALAAI